MQDWMSKLLAVQEKDLRISKIEEQQRSVPLEKAKAQEELKGIESLVTAAKEKTRNAEKAIKTSELDIEAVRTKMRDFQSKSAMIKNNEDYRAALTQAEACKKQIRDLEDKEIVAMEQLEAARQEMATEDKRAGATRQRVAQAAADLDTRAANCKRELDAMLSDRATMLEGIPPEVLRRYDRIRTNRRAERDPRAFVAIREGVCDGCHMNVPAQVRVNAMKGQVMACGMCGRILYVED